ncbi:hypothetical protein WMY93_007317 [Mugilogobius chulae]|uniref:Reverse transcriptase/retrotransposon-derived protein RNase H-like domain-containing protein n=1 Tax=Mugilogobius chulae TaxID=88201 RepID=A0AAW0PFP5_9GOBI
MAQFQVKPPEKFSFKAEDWTKWIKRFERFRIASGLETQADENQVNALIYSMGEEAEDILTSLHLSPEQASEYDTVKQRLETHFIARRNIILKELNSISGSKRLANLQMASSLHCLAEHCGYGPLHDEMVRDRLVVGLRDKRLSEQLQMDPELTLDRAVMKTKIKFLGQIIEATGVSPDPEKVSAVRAMKEPSNISEVRRFLGMTNHLGKFLPHLAEKTRPLRELLRKTNMWSWGPQQMQAFESIKQDLTTPPGLALYDPSAETLVSADSSSYGLGAVLLQKTSTSNWKPIAYASRALSTTEQRYAQIEKEALATTWACERFAEFLIGNDFHIHTDHKPLVPLLGSRNLDELPPRIQRLKMRLMRFSFTISHVPGKEIATADVLSRAPIAHTEEGLHEEEIDLYADAVVASIPATEKRLKEVQKHQDKDEILLQLKQFCLNGWPNKFEIEKGLQPYLPFAANGYSPTELLMGRKIRTTVPVIPSQLDPHGADLGKVKSREQSYRQRQKQNYNKRHRAHDMPSLQQGEHVWIKDMQQRGTVVSTAGTPRSYIVETPNGNLRRNRYHLSRTPVAPRLHITFPDTTSENNPVETEPVSPEVLFDSNLNRPESERRYPVRVRKTPEYLKDYVT